MERPNQFYIPPHQQPWVYINSIKGLKRGKVHEISQYDAPSQFNTEKQICTSHIDWQPYEQQLTVIIQCVSLSSRVFDIIT